MINSKRRHDKTIRIDTQAYSRLVFSAKFTQSCLLALCLVIAGNATAQPPDTDRISTTFAAGAVLSSAVAVQVDDPQSRNLACKTVCSPFEPRQAITRIEWQEKVTPTARALGSETIRIDIVGAASDFNAGNFGTIRVSAVPELKVKQGEGMNLQLARKQFKPVMVQRVVNNKVILRDPALPMPNVLKTETIPRLQPQITPAAKDALQKDALAGGFGRMQVIAQGVEVKKSIPHRNLVLEGMQPGQTYKVRLVEEKNSRAAGLAEQICRIPVCPADFAPPPQ